MTATSTPAPTTGTTTWRHQLGGPSIRRTANQPTTDACSSTNAVSAPTFTTDTRWSRPSSRRAAHTAATRVTTAAHAIATRGTPDPPSTRERNDGSRPSLPIANTSRPAAACPASAAKAAPMALLTATRSCSHVPTEASTAS